MPIDSDVCLQNSPEWGDAYDCKSSIAFCENYGKDMKRCCPDTCNTGVFTEDDCNSFDGFGTCTYPNEAQCTTMG